MGSPRGLTPVSLTALLALGLVAAACGTDSGTVRGVVIDVSGNLDSITQFTVLVEGEPIVFFPSPTGDYAFPLSHLRDHLRSGEPVEVGYEVVDGRPVATFLDDG